MKRILAVLAAGTMGLVAGCAKTPSDLNRLSVGMKKQQVVAVLGQPYYTGAQDDTQVLRYKLAPSRWGKGTQPYYVRLIDGSVESYGRLGDFESAKNLTKKNNLNNRSEASAQ